MSWQRAAAQAKGAIGRSIPRFAYPFVLRTLTVLHAPTWALPRWEYVPEGWERSRVGGGITGWEGSNVAEAYRRKRPEVLEILRGSGPLAFPTSSLLPTGRRVLHDHNTIVTFGYVLALAGRNRRSLSVLDWGGGIGLHYHLGRALVPGLELDYHVKEVAQVCALGLELEPEVTFHEAEACLERGYELVMTSASLQYEERWQSTLSKLALAASDYLFLTRVPVVDHVASYVVHERGDSATDLETLSWVINRNELVKCASLAGATLVREFLIAFDPHVPGVPERQETRAFLFRVSDQ